MEYEKFSWSKLAVETTAYFVIGLLILGAPLWIPLCIMWMNGRFSGQPEYEQVGHTPSADELLEMQKCKQMVQRDKAHNRYKVGDYWVAWPCDNFGRPFPENDYGLP